jgi:hypothetical protein
MRMHRHSAKAGIQKTGWIPGQARDDRPHEVVVNMRKNLGRCVYHKFLTLCPLRYALCVLSLINFPTHSSLYTDLSSDPLRGAPFRPGS